MPELGASGEGHAGGGASISLTGAVLAFVIGGFILIEFASGRLGQVWSNLTAAPAAPPTAAPTTIAPAGSAATAAAGQIANGAGSAVTTPQTPSQPNTNTSVG
jgi:hypothetical protein